MRANPYKPISRGGSSLGWVCFSRCFSGIRRRALRFCRWSGRGFLKPLNFKQVSQFVAADQDRGFLCGPLRISALTAIFNAENAEIRREPQRNRFEDYICMLARFILGQVNSLDKA